MSSDPSTFERLRKVLCTALSVPPEAVTLDSSMDSIQGWDSLRFLFVVEGAEKEFGLKFDRQDLPRLRTVKGLIERIEARIEAGKATS